MTAKLLNFRIENIAPVLSVRDIQRSLKFYVDILGFRNAEWGDQNFTMVTRDNSGLYLCKDEQGVSGTWIWIGFDGDIFQLHQQLKSQKVKIVLAPTNFSHSYEMRVEDPDGHVLRLGTDPNEDEPFVPDT